MAEVDIPTPGQPSVGGSKGFLGTGLPMWAVLGGIGALAGLAVFLYRNAAGTSSGSSNTSSSSLSGSTLLPNTAIMLGSLQQGVQQLQGSVDAGNADLSSQLTGVGENLSATMDTNAANTQQAFSDLSTYLGTNFQNISNSETTLSGAIASLGTQNAGLADSLTQTLTNLQSMAGTEQNILGSVNNALANQNSQQLDLNALGQELTGLGQQQAAIATQIGQQMVSLNTNLGGSIGTTKGELGALATTLGVGSQVQQYLVAHGDYTMGGGPTTANT